MFVNVRSYKRSTNILMSYIFGKTNFKKIQFWSGENAIFGALIKLGRLSFGN